MKDKRHCPHQIWVEYSRQALPHVIILEQVDTYDLQVVIENFPSAQWEIRACILDPRVFGIAMARCRVYCIITLRTAAMWNTDRPLHELIGKLAARQAMSADTFWDEPDAMALRSPTPAELHRLAEYETLPTYHRLSQVAVWDLAQGGGRPRGSNIDGALPCLTTHCRSMYHRQKKMFLSPHMLLRAMGHISDPHCAEAAGHSLLDMSATHCSIAQMEHMAGNAMHLPCIGACLMIVALHVRAR